MASRKIVTSIGPALNGLQWMLAAADTENEYGRVYWILVHKLRAIGTFLLCSTVLRRTEITRSKNLMLKLRVLLKRHLLCSNDVMDPSLTSLFVKVELFISMISDGCPVVRSYRLDGFLNLFNIELIEEEMDRWYTNLSYYLQHCSAGPILLADEVHDIFQSVSENLENFRSFPGPYDVGVLEQAIVALKENIIFWKNFISFVTLISSGGSQELQSLVSHIEPVAIAAAQVTLQLFSDSDYDINGLKSLISTLLLRITPVENPLLLETYARAFESLKSLKELYVPTLDLKDSTSFVMSTLWEILLLETVPVVSFKDKFIALYEGLRYLSIMLSKQPHKFDDRIRDFTRAAIFDAGIIIFSLHQKYFEIDCGVQDFVAGIQQIRSHVLQEPVVKPTEFNFQQTYVLAFLDFLLEDYLMEAKCFEPDLDTLSYVPKIRENLVYLRSFMGALMELRNPQDDLHQVAWNLALEVTYKIESLIDQLVFGNILDSFATFFQSITENIRVIKIHSMEIFNEKLEKIRPHKVTRTFSDQEPSQSSNSEADKIVGFETERSSIIDRLERGSKTLQVVATVGMPGSGKTTLAMKVYDDPSVRYHFHVRARCTISQVFNRRKNLLELLNQLQPDKNFTENDEDDLAQELWRSLLKRRYLIFVDDVWDIRAFDCLKESFPDDSTGSRILLTSRLGDLLPEAILDDKPLILPQLTRLQSLELLNLKLYPARKDWTQPLDFLGMEDVEFCKGLPLTIVLVAGILTSKRQVVWKEAMKSLRSNLVSTLTDECANTIELSYNYLPDHLKPCFLSFSAFAEDEEISVKRLIWLWIAEGFVRKSEFKSLEEVATEYLMSLIDKSLVTVVKERSRGGVKICRIHDLLHSFCLKKASEELFFPVLKGSEELLSFHELGKLRRICVHSEAEHFEVAKLYCPRLRSLFFFEKTCRERKIDMSFILRIVKFLRVLHVEDAILTSSFLNEIGLLQLRYLAIPVGRVIMSSIGNLTNLETLILCPKRRLTLRLPDTFWNLRKLRHLYISKQNSEIRLPGISIESSSNLLQLDSFSTLYCDNCDISEKHLRRLLNIRQLKCRLSLLSDGFLMSFSYLSKLESLSLSFDGLKATELELHLPESLKKLTLSSHELFSKNLSRITQLPNLEVLKILHPSFSATTWHVQEEEFPKLRFLMLVAPEMVNWTASDEQFSKLEKLVLEHCGKMEEIPECLENVATLEVIEVKSCPNRVVSLVKKVEDCQKDMGNSILRVEVDRCYR